MNDWNAYARSYGERARAAARQLALAESDAKDHWLEVAAERLRDATGSILEANARDVAAAPGLGLNAAAIDRLTLTPPRIEGMARGLEEIADLPDPVGEVIEGYFRPNGLEVQRVRVPLGVVFFIYESRPNVTADAAAICVKSGNAVILRGGKEALHSNVAIHQTLADALAECDLPPEAVQLVDTPDRDAVGAFLKQQEFIDLTIPRGGRSLIERVAAEATMPVIKHFDGVCHVFVDRTADLGMAEEILINSKAQRPGVCNAAECLLVHAAIAQPFLKQLEPALQKAGVQVRGDARIREALPWATAATEHDYRTEYLDLILSARVVDNLDEAVAHIETFGSHHTDAIVTSDIGEAEKFVAAVDSAAVMVNASTRFNDGGELGLGAEIGISTDKFHARGPCGLRELTSYKYVVRGSGQVR
ncbi:MAG: glutamate-5-semialdehyde dehydrogenase [Planctomyces sp.]|nr:glutamate-5-semialdehyde dehydrogenase [Planctomyces sp.]